MRQDWPLVAAMAFYVFCAVIALAHITRQAFVFGARLRFQHRRSATKPGTERHAQTIGLRVGYWPCLRAPFITIDFGSHRLDIWHGLPGYKGV